MSREEPLVSVVVPWSGHPDVSGIDRAIEAYALPDLIELVVIADGLVASAWPGISCSDGLVELRVMEQSPQGGPGLARNAGLHECRGKFVAFCDSDDFPDINELVEMAHLATAHSSEVVMGGYRWSTPDQPTRVVLPKSSRSMRVTWKANLWRRPAVWRYLFERQFLAKDKLLFPPTSYAEDLIFLLRVAVRQPRVVTHSRSCYEYRSRFSPDQLSATGPTQGQIDEAVALLGPIRRQGKDKLVAFLGWAWIIRIRLQRIRPNGR